MARLSRKKPVDRIEGDRQLIISYKKFFASAEGKDVLFDLMNKFHILNSHGGDPIKEGQRSVVLHVLSKANVDLAQYDRILKGELDG